MNKTITTLVLMLPLAVFAADDTSGFYFQHQDWEIACDNTGTCRAAGYQKEEGEEVAAPMSVLLTRKAGPSEPVVAELQLGTADDDAFAKVPQPLRLTLRVNGKVIGQVAFRKNEAQAVLPRDQVAALLAALPRSSTIEWRAGAHAWRLSDKGAAAVLLKMDEAQGRLGTPGALVRKGTGDEAAVPPAVPMPVVQVRKPQGKEPRPGVPAALYAALRATIADGDDCPDLKEGDTKADNVSLLRLNDTQQLASAQCWLAAYNMGFAFWVVQDKPPYHPQLVTTNGSDHAEGRIYSSQKGRGLGDCWSSEAWVWDGRRFVHTSSLTTGLCRMVAAGGAWQLPTLVTEVK